MGGWGAPISEDGIVGAGEMTVPLNAERSIDSYISFYVFVLGFAREFGVGGL